MKFHRESEQFKPVTIVLETPQECAAFAVLFSGTEAKEDLRLGLNPEKQHELFQFLKDSSGDSWAALCNKVSINVEVREI